MLIVRTWDVIIVGGGIIGLSLAIALRKRGARVLIVERGEPGHEASSAAGGMLVDAKAETAPALQPLATASAAMYPEFVHELQDESGMNVDLRDQGTLLVPAPGHELSAHDAVTLPAPLAKLEPALAPPNCSVFYLKERSVDPRALAAAAVKAAKHREVDFSSGDPVVGVDIVDGHAAGVTTAKTRFLASKVVNCAGAWSGKLPPHRFPTRPVKGQMLCLAAASRTLLRHVVRTSDVYLIPRSNGRILAGATVEEAGFDKRTDGATIQRLHRAAIATIPALSEARILEAWAGLRPGTPDALPILGATATAGYFVATGHFRDGILLAPITASLMADVVTGIRPAYNLRAFAASRFSH